MPSLAKAIETFKNGDFSDQCDIYHIESKGPHEDLHLSEIAKSTCELGGHQLNFISSKTIEKVSLVLSLLIIR